MSCVDPKVVQRGQVSSSERGAVLIMVLAIITALTLVGALVAQNISNETAAIAAERSASGALYVTEAGIAWGVQHLHELMDEHGIDKTNPDFTALWAVLNKITGDTDCPDASCPLFDFFELHPGQVWVPFGRGAYRVVVGPDPSGNQFVRIRSIGRSPGGARKAIEVILGPEGA